MIPVLIHIKIICYAIICPSWKGSIILLCLGFLWHNLQCFTTLPIYHWVPFSLLIDPIFLGSNWVVVLKPFSKVRIPCLSPSHHHCFFQIRSLIILLWRSSHDGFHCIPPPSPHPKECCDNCELYLSLYERSMTIISIIEVTSPTFYTPHVGLHKYVLYFFV